jgi:hypothetical protein
MTKRQTLVGLGLLLLPAICSAEGDGTYFLAVLIYAFGFQFVIAVGTLVAFSVAGGWKGFTLWCLIVVSICLAYGYRVWQRDEEAAARETLGRTHDAIFRASCARETGEFATLAIAPPDQVYVRVDSGVVANRPNVPGLRDPYDPPPPAANVHYVDEFPVPRKAGDAFVEILPTSRAATERPVLGIYVRITNSGDELAAGWLDFEGPSGWCLGGHPHQSIERFVSHVLGRGMAAAAATSAIDIAVPNVFVQGKTSALEKGRFGTRTLVSPTDTGAPAGLNEALVECQCVGDGTRKGTMRCGEAAPRLIDANLVIAYRRIVGGILLVSRVDNEPFLYRIDVTALASNGAIRSVWRVRFPEVDMAPFSEGGPFAGDSLGFRDKDEIAVDLLIGRVETGDFKKVTRRALWTHKTVLTAVLPGVSEIAE